MPACSADPGVSAGTSSDLLVGLGSALSEAASDIRFHGKVHAAATGSMCAGGAMLHAPAAGRKLQRRPFMLPALSVLFMRGPTG